MSRNTRAAVILSFALGSRAAGPVDAKITPAIGKYCHIVHFPQGWSTVPFIRNHDVLNTATPIAYSYWSDYEFRIPGLLGTQFLVRGFDRTTGRLVYTNNIYRVDFSDPKSVPTSLPDTAETGSSCSVSLAAR